MSEKPLIFISHSSRDGELTNVLKEQLETLMDVDVFETSHFGAIEGGEEWFEVITQKLDQADALLVLVSPNSFASTWVHWELGYFYKRNARTTQTLKVFAGTVAGQPTFPSIADKQVKSLNDTNELKFFLENIAKHFEKKLSDKLLDKAVGEIIVVAPLHVSDESAVEKIRDYLRYDYEAGRWIDYIELDRQLGIRLGTSQDNIQKIVEKDNLGLLIKEVRESGARLRKRPPVVHKM